MTALFKCSACPTIVPAIHSSRDCFVPPKGWGRLQLVMLMAIDNDGGNDEIRSDEEHLCPACMEKTDADLLVKDGLPRKEDG